MGEFFSSIGDSISGFVGDGIGGIIQTILDNTIYRLMYYIVVGICWLLQLAYELLEVFAGLTQVKYGKDYLFLIEVFFSNQAITNAYWGMALLGIVCCVGFTIYAVSKKMFDSGGKLQQSMGGILTNMFKSMLIILSMSAVMVVTISTTNTLFDSINEIFTRAPIAFSDDEITFEDEQYATMARIMNTVGNYSLSPAYSSRYNVNSCFNAIRADMYLLAVENVFDYDYDSFEVKKKNAAGDEITELIQMDSWQRSLKAIANSANLTQDLKMDAYNEGVAKSITSLMEELRRNPSFKPLKSYKRVYAPPERMRIDRLVFLMGTLRGAKNTEYNEKPSLTDPLRGAYYNGTKDMYDFDTVTTDFSISIAGYEYIIVIFAATALVWSFINMIFTFMKRIFYMLMLYLVAPPAIASMPMDEGEKFKQWTSSFVIQCFGVFGTLITLHVFLIFMPIIFSEQLVLFEDSIILNLVGKLLLLIGGAYACREANNLITGIIAGNAGAASLAANNNNEVASAGQSMAISGAGKLGGMAGRTAGLVMGGAYKGAKWTATELPGKIKRGAISLGQKYQALKRDIAKLRGDEPSGGSAGSSSPWNSAGSGQYSQMGSGQAGGGFGGFGGFGGGAGALNQPASQRQSGFSIQSQGGGEALGRGAGGGANQPSSQRQSGFSIQSQGGGEALGRGAGGGSAAGGGANQPSSQRQSGFSIQSQGGGEALGRGAGGGAIAPDKSGGSVSIGGTNSFSINSAPQNKPLPPQSFRK